jgi:hypothetical protein
MKQYLNHHPLYYDQESTYQYRIHGFATGASV